MYCLRYELTLKSTYLENDIHLNRRGHDVVGRELASFLVGEGFVIGNTQQNHSRDRALPPD